MAKYYKETMNKASLRYKKKNTEQINISFQTGQGIGRLIHLPEKRKEDQS